METLSLVITIAAIVLGVILLLRILAKLLEDGRLAELSVKFFGVDITKAE